jgi:hypothetical protein
VFFAPPLKIGAALDAATGGAAESLGGDEAVPVIGAVLAGATVAGAVLAAEFSFLMTDGAPAGVGAPLAAGAEVAAVLADIDVIRPHRDLPSQDTSFLEKLA